MTLHVLEYGAGVKNKFCRLFAMGLISLLFLTGGCAYMRVRTPMDRDFGNTELGTREGRSHVTSLLWVLSWGDAGTKAAAENGGIKVIKHADQETFVILFGAYARYTTVVYGE